MRVAIRIHSIYSTHWGTPKVFTVDAEDMLGVRAILGDALNPEVEWLTSICNAVPFCKGHDTYVIPPATMDLMNSTYRGKIISIERIAE